MPTIIPQILLSICFVAGKSGGHLLPCITQAENMMKKNDRVETVLFSSGTDLEKKIMSQHQKIKNIVPSKLNPLPKRQLWKLPLFFYNFTKYFINSCYQLYKIKPTKIISYGGLVSIPVCLAGKLLGIPFELYELNVEPGKTIKFLSNFTQSINICFSETAKFFKNKQCNLVDYPVRFTHKDKQYDKAQLLKQYNLQKNRKTILILGGSQGSIFINQSFQKTLIDNPKLQNKIQVIHQTGSEDSINYQEFYNQHKIPALVFSYNERLQDFYNLADVIICRAGAGTLFEVKFFNKQCIIIPLETNFNNHQVRNAYAIAKMNPHKFTVILQKECPVILPLTLTKIIN